MYDCHLKGPCHEINFRPFLHQTTPLSYYILYMISNLVEFKENILSLKMRLCGIEQDQNLTPCFLRGLFDRPICKHYRL
jgi:hypothetical protein